MTTPSDLHDRSGSGRGEHVLVLGATGYLGRAVTRRLVAGGDHVRALVRSPERAASLPPEVAITVGDAADEAVLATTITDDTTSVVNLLAPEGPEQDGRVTRVVLDTLGTVPGRSYLYVSGVWVLGSTPAGSVADEGTPTRPLDLVAHRPDIERAVLDAARHGVRGLVVRPGIVHGHGGGIPRLLVDLAGQHGHGVRVGDGPVRWPMVHVDDLAELVRLVLRGAPGEGGLFHAVAEPAVDTAELALAAAEVAGVAGEVRAWPVSDAAGVLGAGFAEALACDQAVAAHESAALGWAPSRPGAVPDLLAAREAAADSVA